jgi:DNA mismatch repair protein MutS
MQADKTTLNDLSIFAHEEEQSLFHHLNFTRTYGGNEWLRNFLSHPIDNVKKITETQQTIQRIIAVNAVWPILITNGTVMVIEKYFETAIQEIPSHSTAVSSFFYRSFNASDFSHVRYSVKHAVDFIKGMNELCHILADEKNPPLLSVLIERVQLLLSKPALQQMLLQKKGLTIPETLSLGHFIRRHFKDGVEELIEICGKLDAYYSMAVVCINDHLYFPAFTESDKPLLVAKALYHPLLANPVSYNISLDDKQNFLFLTGANMAGKSTFIKAIGISVYLAHIGMGVPAETMQLSFFDGLLSNINVVDNVIQGESYFFNEVQRIRKTIEKISDGKKWLILIDELFKGTNVQDAMKCSSVVIEGLRKMHSTLFILSTHLYEIGESLKQYPNIQFRYFETAVKDDQLVFSYQLQNGISNDRLGYLILKREGVVEMLEKL